MTIKEIKAALQTPGTVFKYPVKFGRMKEFKTMEGTKFDTEKDDFIGTGQVTSIYVNDVWSYDGMNVRKFGPKCVSLYSFDMLGKKTVGMIKYEFVEIVSVGGKE